MRKLRLLTSIFLVTLGLATSIAPAFGATPEGKTPVLTRAQFDTLAAEPKNLLIIDVRRPDEVTKIGGFPVYLSVQLGDLEQNLAWIPKDRRIVVISNHAKRAIRAGDVLTAKGYKVAGSLGVQDYEGEGGKIVRIAPPPPKTAATAQPADKSVTAAR